LSFAKGLCWLGYLLGFAIDLSDFNFHDGKKKEKARKKKQLQRSYYHARKGDQSE